MEHNEPTLIGQPQVSFESTWLGIIRKSGKKIGWIAFGIVCFTWFTITKLPEDRLGNYIQGQLNSSLSQIGMSINPKESGMSVGLGITYWMKDVAVLMSSSPKPITLDRIEISPSLMWMFAGKLGAGFYLKQSEGTVRGKFSIPLSFGTKTSTPTKLALDLNIDKLNLSKLGALEIFAGLKAGGMLGGSLSIAGDFSRPETVNGNADLHLDQFNLDPQTFMGFSIPNVKVQKTVMNLSADSGKIKLQNLKLGQAGSPDDVIGNVTGEAILNRNVTQSNLNFKTRFSLAPSILKAFIILDSILQSGKQPDGSYSYKITGPFATPLWQPAPP